MLDRLKMVDGAEFGKRCVEMQTEANKETIDLFHDYSKSGDDKALTKMAAQTLPAIEKHPAQAKKRDVKK